MPSHDGPSCRHSSFEWREPGLFEAARSLPGATLRQPFHAAAGFRPVVVEHPEFGSWYHGMALDMVDWSDGAGRRLHFAPSEDATGVSIYFPPSEWTHGGRGRFVAVVGALIPASQAELQGWANESSPLEIADGAYHRFVQVPRAVDPARLMEALQAGTHATAWQSSSGHGYVTLAWPGWELRAALPSVVLPPPAGRGIGVDGADLVRLELYPDIVSTQVAKRTAREAFADLGLPDPSFRQWASTDC